MKPSKLHNIFAEHLSAMAVAAAEVSLNGRIVELQVDEDLGLLLEIPPGEYMTVATAAGGVRIRAARPQSNGSYMYTITRSDGTTWGVGPEGDGLPF